MQPFPDTDTEPYTLEVHDSETGITLTLSLTPNLEEESTDTIYDGGLGTGLVDDFSLERIEEIRERLQSQLNEIFNRLI